MIEDEFLNSGNDFMIKTPTDSENVKLKKDKNGNELRRGIEKFLVLNKKCPQTDVFQLKGKVKVISRNLKYALSSYFKPSEKELLTAESEVHKYIETLTDMITKIYPDDKEKIEKLKDTLIMMTKANPDQRPTMDKAIKQFS